MDANLSGHKIKNKVINAGNMLSPRLSDQLLFEKTSPGHCLPKYMSTHQRAFLAESNRRIFRRLDSFPLHGDAKRKFEILRDATLYDSTKYASRLRRDEMQFLDAMDRQIDVCQNELGAHVFVRLVDDTRTTPPGGVHARNFAYYAACARADESDIDCFSSGIDDVARYWNKRAARACIQYVREAYRFEQIIKYALSNVE